jgi:hypothetical protein
MLNGVGEIAKAFWQNIGKPLLIYCAIALAFYFIGLLVGGCRIEPGSPDTELDRIGAELAAERQRIVELEGTVTDLTGRNQDLRDAIIRASRAAHEIDQSINRLEGISGDMAEKLRGTIEALQDIQTAIRDFRRSLD